MARPDSDYAPSGLIADDPFSLRFHELMENPGAVRASSTITTVDKYKHTTTWVIDTFRDGGTETVFIQRISAEGPVRLVLPSAVTAVITRQHERATTSTRKRVARAVVEMRRERGDTLGNPEALKLARKRQRKGRA